MKFSTREDIAANIEYVFASVSDFGGLERAALRRGADVVRTDTLSAPGPGMSWRATFPFRNRERQADMKLTHYEAPHGMVLFSKISGIEAEVRVDLVALSPRRTRLNLDVEMKPKSIPARLMMQSMKLARGNLVKKFRRRVADYAQTIEDRARS
ncbi:SRPBCC family protein [Aliiroseovarius crassostreae]|uniref:SRPBCC family protein n=1 Tax=Aliiroseovarius crassostreae TaxID=154981 RepID=A0A9Q9H768_9RHOB|nr:SRPBCC family protein [Aliiroseovarius crassostreae]UWP88530.1 SRPBCC family protein [Aliiroseovarius crassostreae]UWP91693.1 SRPBCC family protein [Aliiroseovarius crassostreae]UWP94838.1 SRPBCC family protein [Aliiroseovarius crassostreae]UWP98000.1 SRPBCC family protein [Aliiroseovarius crassostreae]UWQ01184.1 SRPBCC family protein [Aliiroseovarius crassostreae]